MILQFQAIHDFRVQYPTIYALDNRGRLWVSESRPAEQAEWKAVPDVPDDIAHPATSGSPPGYPPADDNIPF